MKPLPNNTPDKTLTKSRRRRKLTRRHLSPEALLLSQEEYITKKI
jgi:hypothetical protein